MVKYLLEVSFLLSASSNQIPFSHTHATSYLGAFGQAGASVEQKDNNEQTPFDLAKQNKHEEICKAIDPNVSLARERREVHLQGQARSECGECLFNVIA